MEDVMSDRAQVVILGGFLLALGVVVITITFNSLIFSQDVASRDTGIRERNLMEYRESMNDTLQEAVPGNFSSPSKAEAHYERFLNAYVNRSREQKARRGTVVSLRNDPSSHTKDVAYAVGQRGIGEFENSSNDADWVMAEDIGEVHRMEFNISRDGTDDGFIINATDNNDFGCGFPVCPFNQGWSVEVRNSTDRLKINYNDFSTIQYVPLPNKKHVVVNLTSGDVDPSDGVEEFGGIDDPGGLGEPGAVRFESGNQIEGTYDFRFDDGATIEGPCDPGSSACATSGSPEKYVTGIIHKVEEVAFEYANSKVQYNETLTVVADKEDIRTNSSTGTGTVSGSSNFEATITDAVPNPVEAGEDLDVEVEITNTGSSTDTKTVKLEINNGEGVKQTQNIMLNSGQTKTRTFTWSTDPDDDGGPSGSNTAAKEYTATITTDVSDSVNVDVCDKVTGGGCAGGGP